MRSSSTRYTVDLREEIVDKALRTVFEKAAKQPRKFVWYTSIIGYIKWEMAMIQHIHPEIPKVYYYSPQKGRIGLVISMGSKQSLVKAYYRYSSNDFVMKYGTDILFTFNSFGIETFNKVKKYL